MKLPCSLAKGVGHSSNEMTTFITIGFEKKNIYNIKHLDIIYKNITKRE